MTRETKIGMIVATSFLSLVGVVVGTKWYKKDIPGNGTGDKTPGLQAFAQSGPTAFPKIEPSAPAKQEPPVTPKSGTITPAVFTQSSPLPEVSPAPAGLNFSSIGAAGIIEASKNALVPPPANNDFNLPPLPGNPEATKDPAQSLRDTIQEQERNAKNGIIAVKDQFVGGLNQAANDVKEQLKEKANKALQGLPEIPVFQPPIMVAQGTPNATKPDVAPPIPPAPNFDAKLPIVAAPTTKATTDAPPSLPPFGKPDAPPSLPPVGKSDSPPLPVFGQQPLAPPVSSGSPPVAPPVPPVTNSQPPNSQFPPVRKDETPLPNGGFTVPPPPFGNGNSDIGKIPQIPGQQPTPPNPQNNGFTVPPPPQTNGFNDPAKIPGGNDSRPIPQIPGPPNGGAIPPVSVPGVPVVRTDTPTTYICQGNENYALIARSKYGSDGYARALEEYNRAFPGASENVRATPPQLTSGTKVYIPDVDFLRERYGQLVNNTAAPAATLIPSAQPAPLGSQIGIGLPKPAPQNAFPPIAPTQPNQGAANAATFVVPAGGLYIAQIADRRLGNPQRWIEIYRLNPALDPTQPIREGTEIRIPAK